MSKLYLSDFLLSCVIIFTLFFSVLKYFKNFVETSSSSNSLISSLLNFGLGILLFLFEMLLNDLAKKQSLIYFLSVYIF